VTWYAFEDALLSAEVDLSNTKVLLGVLGSPMQDHDHGGIRQRRSQATSDPQATLRGSPRVLPIRHERDPLHHLTLGHRLVSKPPQKRFTDDQFLDGRTS
jgi:hypothetical protein